MCLCVCSCNCLNMTPISDRRLSVTRLTVMAFCMQEKKQCLGMGKKEKKKMQIVVTGWQEVTAVLQAINLFHNLTDMHLNRYLSSPTSTDIHTSMVYKD